MSERTKLALVMWEHLMLREGAGLSWQERADLFWILYERLGRQGWTGFLNTRE